MVDDRLLLLLCVVSVSRWLCSSSSLLAWLISVFRCVVLMCMVVFVGVVVVWVGVVGDGVGVRVGGGDGVVVGVDVVV